MMSLESFGGCSPQVDESAWVHPAATLIGDVTVGAESSIWPGAVLRADFGPIRIGRRTSIQDNVVLHGAGSGTVVGDNCIVGHLAFIEEAVVEDHCLIGVGARVLNGARVRSDAVVAAGAVLVQGLEVPTGTRAQGVPARIVPEPGRARDKIRPGADRYVELSSRYRSSNSQTDRMETP